MTQARTEAAIEVTKAVIMAVRKVDTCVNNARPIHTVPISGDPILCQPTFDWKATDKDQEIFNFEVKVKNIFMTNN